MLLKRFHIYLYFCKDQNPDYFKWAQPAENHPLLERFSSLAKENRVFLSDQINIENPKTKDFVEFLNKNELKDGLFIVDEISNNLSLASRNLPNVNVTNLNTLNPINLLKFNSVVIVENCLNLIEEKLS